MNYPMNIDGEFQAELEVNFSSGSKGVKMFYGDSMQEVQNFAYHQLTEIITEGNLGLTSKVESFKISAQKA